MADPKIVSRIRREDIPKDFGERYAILYVDTLTTPRSIPPGRVLVHNHVCPVGFPDVPLGFNGFRVWSQRLSRKYLRPCRCGWAPHLPRHFRMGWVTSYNGTRGRR